MFSRVTLTAYLSNVPDAQLGSQSLTSSLPWPLTLSAFHSFQPRRLSRMLSSAQASVIRFGSTFGFVQSLGA